MESTDDDDGLIREVVRASDPTRGLPILPAQAVAAELRARADTADLDGVDDGEPDVTLLSVLMRDALSDTPVGSWLISDQTERREVFGCYFHELAALLVADPSAIVDVSAGHVGFAWWLDAVNYALEPEPEHDEVLNRTCGRYADRFRLFDTITRHALTRAGFQTCWVLAGIGVDPSRRGAGVGSELLSRRLDDLDATFGWPLWAVAVSAPHRTLLERHGYTAGPAAFLPDSGPPIWPMRRPAPDEAAGPDVR